MQMIDILKNMVMIPALSGYEERMAKYMCDTMSPFADEISVDQAGNLIAKINGKDANAPKIMIFAHMDQLGFVVRKIDEDGYIRLERLGGIPEKALPGLKVLIQSETGSFIPGVIGVKAHHATPAEEKYTVIPYQQLFIDIGAQSAQEVRSLGIEIGCPVVYQPQFEKMLGRRISATSIDDRAGCAILVKLAELAAKKRPEANLYLVGSVQEEFNLRGACLAAAAIKPDFAISLDIMVAGDTPDLKERSELKLGNGPILGMYSFHGRGTLNGTIPHPGLVKLVKDSAAQEKIKLQRSAGLGSLTDSAYVQLVDKGIPVIDLGYPARYTHTPVEICDLDDLDGLLALLWVLINKVDGKFKLVRQ